MNFFSWVRDGVRQAVLLGVSDAVGDIGTPPEGDDIGQRLLQVMRNGQPGVDRIAVARPSAAEEAGAVVGTDSGDGEDGIGRTYFPSIFAQSCSRCCF